jgi:hypothetical protein
VAADRLGGRSNVFPLAWLLDRLSVPSRFATAPKESRLIPDVDNLGICLLDDESSPVIDDAVLALAVLPVVRFRLLIVTLDGM